MLTIADGRAIPAVSWQFLINSNALASGSGNNTARSASGILDVANANKYDLLVKACLATGAHCAIDIHNYARFEGKIIGQGGPSNADFANLWSQLATKVGVKVMWSDIANFPVCE